MNEIDFNKVQFLLALLDAKDTDVIRTEEGNYAVLQKDAFQGEKRELIKTELLNEMKITNKHTTPIIKPF